MTADNLGTFGAKHLRGGRHDLGQPALLHFGRQTRKDDRRQNGLRLCAHRPDIAQRMNGCDLGHRPRILGEGAQMIGGNDLPPALWPGQDRGIVTGAR